MKNTRRKTPARKSVSGKRKGGVARSRRSSRAKTSSQFTTDHDEIRHWAEERGGHPATVARTGGRGGQEAGILRIDFPNFRPSARRAASLKEIDWNEFFDKFDDSNLVFLFQNKTKSGRPSRFARFVSRDTARKKKAA